MRKKKLYLYADCRFDKESRLQPEPYPSSTLTFSDSACAKDVEMKMESGVERNGSKSRKENRKYLSTLPFVLCVAQKYDVVVWLQRRSPAT